MSEITNVILTTYTAEQEQVAELGERLYPHGVPGLVSCTDERFDPPWYGGDKYMAVNIHLGAFREFDVDHAIAVMRQIRWQDPEWVQLFICQGRDQRFVEVAWRKPTDVGDDDSALNEEV